MQIRRQTSLIFRRYLQDKSDMCPFHSYADTNNYVYFQIGSKRLTNFLDLNKASSDLLKHNLNNQKCLTAKIGVITSNFDDPCLQSGYTNDISLELTSGTVTPDYAHLRTHFRRFLSYDPFIFQYHVKFDKILGETDSRLYFLVNA